jgi:hypothetical protein
VSADALRAIRRLLPDAEILQNSTPEAALYGGAYSEPPTLRQATVAEGTILRAIRVPNEPQVRFAAFLDGIQHVRILSHWRGVPIILGTVAAVVRVREQRWFVTWERRGPMIARCLYLPRCYIPGIEAADVDGFEIVDTAEVPPGTPLPSRHPGALRACAIDRIRADRERLERQLAATWCAHEEAPICIDGGVSGIHGGEKGSAACAVGVIKSHQTLYADGDALTTVLSLAAGERSSVFRIEPRRLSSKGGSADRATVVSWYLRLRDPHGEDAMFGLVRVEAMDVGDMTARADELSAWILAESAPLSLPDGRWDKMLYGIRDCEEFLRAIAS